MANEAQFRHKTMIANAVGTFPELFRLQSNTALEVDNRIMQIIKLTDWRTVGLTHTHTAALQWGFCGYCAHSYCAQKSIFILKTNNKRLCAPNRAGTHAASPTRRVRLFKRIFNALLCRIPPPPHTPQQSTVKLCRVRLCGEVTCLVLLLSLGSNNNLLLLSLQTLVLN